MQCLIPMKHRAMHARAKGRQSHAKNSNGPHEPHLFLNIVATIE